MDLSEVLGKAKELKDDSKAVKESLAKDSLTALLSSFSSFAFPNTSDKSMVVTLIPCRSKIFSL